MPRAKKPTENTQENTVTETAEKAPRNIRTPEQRAAEAFEAAQRAQEKAGKRLEKARGEVVSAEKAVKRAAWAYGIAKSNPDLDPSLVPTDADDIEFTGNDEPELNDAEPESDNDESGSEPQDDDEV